jgi:hypothetical protein
VIAVQVPEVVAAAASATDVQWWILVAAAVVVSEQVSAVWKIFSARRRCPTWSEALRRSRRLARYRPLPFQDYPSRHPGGYERLRQRGDRVAEHPSQDQTNPDSNLLMLVVQRDFSVVPDLVGLDDLGRWSDWLKRDWPMPAVTTTGRPTPRGRQGRLQATRPKRPLFQEHSGHIRDPGLRTLCGSALHPESLTRQCSANAGSGTVWFPREEKSRAS